MVISDPISFYEKNGYYVFPDCLTPGECREYLEEAERLAGQQSSKYSPLINPDRLTPVFRRLLAWPSVVKRLEEIQGRLIDGLQSMLYFKPPGSLGRDLHQDNHYAKAEYGAYLGTWVPLEDTDRENGGLIVYPESHKEPLLDILFDEERIKTNAGDFKNDRGTSCKVPPGYEKIYLTVPAGSCVVIHGHLVHGSEENLSPTRFRRVFAGHYINQGQAFISGKHAKRTAIDLHAHD